MTKRKVNKIIGILLIVISVSYLIYIFYKELNLKIKQNENLQIYFNQHINNGNQIIKDYLMVLEIPKIELKQGIYDLNDKRNNIDENITILNGSNKDANLLILVGHSGNSYNAYFKNLYKLRLNDDIKIYYKKEKYSYKVSKIYSNLKSDIFSIGKNDKNKVILVTCLNKQKYLIIECT